MAKQPSLPFLPEGSLLELSTTRLTSIEAIVRHRERHGYYVIQELQSIFRTAVTVFPPTQMRITLMPRPHHDDAQGSEKERRAPRWEKASLFLGSSDGDSTVDVSKSGKGGDNTVEGEEETVAHCGGDAEGPAVVMSSNTAPSCSIVDLKYIHRCDAALQFLTENGFAPFEVDSRVTLQLINVPPASAAKDRALFVKEMTAAVSLLQWAAECNTSLITVRCGKLVLMRQLTDEYRVVVRAEWCDEIGAKQVQEISSDYHSHQAGMVALSSGGLGAAMRGGGLLAEDSYDGSEDGLHCSVSSTDSTPSRVEVKAPEDDEDDAGSSRAAATEGNNPLEPEGTTASRSPPLQPRKAIDEAVDKISFKFSSLFAKLRDNKDTPPPAEANPTQKATGGNAPHHVDPKRNDGDAVPQQPDKIKAPPEPSMYRYTEHMDAFNTKCDTACDVSVMIYRKRPIIMDKLEAVGFFHYRNFGLCRVDIDLKDPERPVGLPVGRLTLEMLSLSHKFFEIEEHARERQLSAASSPPHPEALDATTIATSSTATPDKRIHTLDDSPSLLSSGSNHWRGLRRKKKCGGAAAAAAKPKHHFHRSNRLDSSDSIASHRSDDAASTGSAAHEPNALGAEVSLRLLSLGGAVPEEALEAVELSGSQRDEETDEIHGPEGEEGIHATTTASAMRVTLRTPTGDDCERIDNDDYFSE